VDAAHPARMIFAGAVRSGARAKLEGNTGGQCWRVIDTINKKDRVGAKFSTRKLRSNKVLILLVARTKPFMALSSTRDSKPHPSPCLFQFIR